MLTVPNTAEISVTALLSYCSITLRYVELEKSLLVGSEILGLFVNTLTATDKYSCHNSKNSPQLIQMQ